jgi:transmembrane sensor
MRSMSNDRTVKLNAQVSEEAAEWFVQFRTGELDIGDREAFDAWVRTSPEHLRAYLEIAAIWNEGSALDAERVLDVDTLIARARADGNVVRLSESAVEQKVSPSIRSRGLYALAAAFALITFVTMALLWFHRVPEYVTGIGEQRSIRLPDGSTVEINSHSRVRVGFTETERSVELLDGQALFSVAKDPARPFVVHSNGARVRAVGTKFDVYRKRGGTIVTVVEGRVAIDTSAASSAPHTSQPPSTHVPSQRQRELAPVLLSAGERVTLAAHVPPRPARVDPAVATAWTQGQLVLDSAPLAEVAEEFNRYSTRKLTVQDSADMPLRLSGVFNTDPDFLIRYLRERPDVTVRETATEILITRHE